MADQKSTLKTLTKCQIQTKAPLLCDIFTKKNLQKWPIKVNFPGWRKPHQIWGNWVENSSLKFAKNWELSGICDGILSSLHEIKPNPKIILALCEYWCSKTNTFHFPWGEATVTLEDVTVLSGLPVYGEPVNACVTEEGDLKSLEPMLHQVKNALSVTGNECDDWVMYFNEASNDEMEYVGFLAFWLSSFVFSDLNDSSVGSLGFSVAVRLAAGVRVALAPAVLACLYQSLTFLTQHAAEFDSAKKEVSVPGPFQILQVWALERFPLLGGSKLAKRLCLGQPRIGRWDKVRVKGSLVGVRRVLRSSGESFCWRPYALVLENWRHRPFDVDVEKVLSDCSGDADDELKSFRVCLQPQELIGIDCTATYQPQRVMMQFGCGLKVDVETAFSGNLESGNVRFCKAEESSEPGDYTLWKESVSAHGNAITEGVKQQSNDGDQKKLILRRDIKKTELNVDEGSDLLDLTANVSPESKVLNVSGNDSGTKQDICSRDEEQSLEGPVVLDSDDEEADKLARKDVKRSRSCTKKLKRRVGDSADYPLYIVEYSNKKEKKSGKSFGNPIDVENYLLC